MNNAGGARRARRLVVATVLLAAGLSALLLGANVASAAAGGGISGTVVDASGGAPIEEIWVCAEPSSVGFSACDFTAADGTYAISGLAPGSYRVAFSVPFGSDANYIAQYYGGTSWANASLVTVTEGVTKSGVNSAMHAGARIVGEVVAAAGKAPLESIEACVFATGGAGELVRCRQSGPDGKYLIAGLPSGSYEVRFAAGFGEVSPGEFGRLNYVTQYFSGKAGKAEADPVTATAGLTTSEVDAEMEVGGAVAGLVTDAVSTEPVEGVEACPYPAGSQSAEGCDFTDEDGEYEIVGLATGSYRIGFTPSFGDQVHALQYYDGKATLAAANPLSVVQGGTVSGVDAELPELGGIEGVVTAAAGGTPIAGSEICATWIGAGSGALDFGCDLTGPGGDYAIGGLREGPYRVEFKGGLDYVTQYYSGKVSSFSADAVSVTNATMTSSIDAALQAAGKISGKVIDATSKGALQSIQVCAQKPSGAGGSCAVTGSDGRYTIGGLEQGSYAVRFSLPPYNIVNYLIQFYGGYPREGEATPVVVTTGATTPSIDAEMHPGGTIDGKVIDASSKDPLEGVNVCATPTSTRRSLFGDCDSTDATGEYSVARLPTGTYKVRFSTFPPRGYVSGYYDGKETKGTADPVTVTAGAATHDVDAELHQGGKIEGTVVDASTKSPLQGIDVCLRGKFESCVGTDATGKYAVAGLPTGSYKVAFSTSFPSHGYIGQYYDGKATREAAELVTVSEGVTVANIDAELQRGGTISGEVTDAVSEKVVDAVRACVYQAVNGEFEGCDSTNADGEYAIEGLRTGSYKVKFSPGGEFGGPGLDPPNYNYVSQYYSDKATRDVAEPVSVTAGATTPNIDAAMHEGGQIEGRVVDALTKAPIQYTAACVYDPDEGEYSRCGYTDADGNYTIEGLATGSYKVRFSPNRGYEGEQSSYLPQFYADQASEVAASPVSVTAPSAQTGIDAELDAAGLIKGRVTAASDGVPLAFVFVCALEPVGAEEPLNCAETSADGQYAITGLATGSYKVSFEAINYEEGFEEAVSEEEFATQYYDSKASRANAVLVSVTAGGPAVISIDAEMVEGPTGPEPEGGAGAAAGGGAAGGPSVGVVPPAPPLLLAPPRKPVGPVRCKKGFDKKKVHGKMRCVRVRKHSGKRR